MPNNEGLEAFGGFLEKLDRKTRERLQVARDVTNEMLPSASLEYNWATGGGVPRGAITTLYGNYSSPKTALVLESLGQLQKKRQVCAVIDSEHTFDKVWAQRLGVDVDRLFLIRKKSFGAIVDEVVPLI